MSTCSVAASYKPPMLVTRVRLPACAVLSVALLLLPHFGEDLKQCFLAMSLQCKRIRLDIRLTDYTM